MRIDLSRTYTPEEEQEILLEIMHDAGWHEGRDIPIQEWVDMLAQEGILVFDAAVRVLREFGGLHLLVPAKYPSGFCGTVNVLFDPVYVGSGDADRFEHCEKVLHQKFYPLGLNEQWMLFIGEDGWIYLYGNDDVFLLGKDIWSALRHMCFRKGDGEFVFRWFTGGAPQLFTGVLPQTVKKANSEE